RFFGDSVLDDVRVCEVAARSPVFVDALRARFASAGLSDPERAKIGAGVLPVLLASGRRDDASELLDELDGLALRGIGRDEFMNLLLAPGCYEPAWSREDALWSRARILMSVGDYEGAARVLEATFHRALVGTEDYAIAEAEDILSEIRRLGI